PEQSPLLRGYPGDQSLSDRRRLDRDGGGAAPDRGACWATVYRTCRWQELAERSARFLSDRRQTRRRVGNELGLPASPYCRSPLAQGYAAYALVMRLGMG